jgi:hypothetical protein
MRTLARYVAVGRATIRGIDRVAAIVFVLLIHGVPVHATAQAARHVEFSQVIVA